MTNMRAALLGVVAVIVGLTITLFAYHLYPKSDVSGAFGGISDKQMLTALSASLAFIAMIVGVLLGSLYRQLLALRSQNRRRVNIKIEVRKLFKSIDVYIGLVASPLVFGILWSTISNISLSGAIVIALQNGFVIQTIVENFTNKQATAAPNQT